MYNIIAYSPFLSFASKIRECFLLQSNKIIADSPFLSFASKIRQCFLLQSNKIVNKRHQICRLGGINQIERTCHFQKKEKKEKKKKKARWRVAEKVNGFVASCQQISNENTLIPKN